MRCPFCQRECYYDDDYAINRCPKCGDRYL